MNTPKLQVPGKCFVLGEYAVLSGSPAIILVHDPLFRLEAAPAAFPFHLDSPAGLLWQEAGSPSWPQYEFVDGYHKRGGFGGSTAEFILVARLFFPEWDAWTLWQKYRSLHAQAKLPPSGVDLLAQSLPFSSARPIYVDPVNAVLAPLPAAPFLVLRTGTKVATHLHLQSLGGIPAITNAPQIIKLAKQALEAQDYKSLGQSLNGYHEALMEQKLLHSIGIELRTKALALPGVFGAKTCGAQGADAVIACIEPNSINEAVAACRSQGLELIYPN